ncbi:MAG: hypothetical protein ABEH43_04010, partial [Flavobacteriales bacterium]
DDKKQSLEKIKDELVSLTDEAFNYLKQHKEEYFTLKLLKPQLYGMALLKEIEQFLEAQKKEKNTLLISDFNRKISNIVL